LFDRSTFLTKKHFSLVGSAFSFQFVTKNTSSGKNDSCTTRHDVKEELGRKTVIQAGQIQ
jgi:hypothetical protein